MSFNFGNILAAMKANGLGQPVNSGGNIQPQNLNPAPNGLLGGAFKAFPQIKASQPQSLNTSGGLWGGLPGLIANHQLFNMAQPQNGGFNMNPNLMNIMALIRRGGMF